MKIVVSSALFGAVLLVSAGFADPSDEARQIARKLAFEAQASQEAGVADAVKVLLASKTFMPRLVEALREGSGSPAAPSSTRSDESVRRVAEEYLDGHVRGYERYTGNDMTYTIQSVSWDGGGRIATVSAEVIADGKVYPTVIKVDSSSLKVLPK